MNKLQNIFHAVTGFKASYIARDAESEGWEDWSAEDLVNVIDNLDLESIEIKEAEKIHNALTDFKNCETGQGSDLDIIFNSLEN